LLVDARWAIKRTWKQSIALIASVALVATLGLGSFVGGYRLGYVQGWEGCRLAAIDAIGFRDVEPVAGDHLRRAFGGP
jgi:hypothetical protein